jgi:hypothetical protein
MKYVYWKALFAGVLISGFTSAFVKLLLKVFPSLDLTTVEAVEDILSYDDSGLFLGFMLFIIVIVSPLIEEMLFRGLIWNVMSKFVKVEVVYVVVSLLFALIHLDPLHILGLLPISFLLGWFKYKTGNIKASIVCHMSNNLTACLIMMV